MELVQTFEARVKQFNPEILNFELVLPMFLNKRNKLSDSKQKPKQYKSGVLVIGD